MISFEAWLEDILQFGVGLIVQRTIPGREIFRIGGSILAFLADLLSNLQRSDINTK